MTWLAFALMSAAAWRAAWFIQRDSLLDIPRDRFSHWLRSNPSTTRLQLLEFLTCPFCLTVWTAAGAVALWPTVTGDPWWGWAFLYWWMGVATGAVFLWRIIAGNE